MPNPTVGVQAGLIGTNGSWANCPNANKVLITLVITPAGGGMKYDKEYSINAPPAIIATGSLPHTFFWAYQW